MDKKLSHLAIPSSEITPEKKFFNRRDFLKSMGIITASSLLVSCAPKLFTPTPENTPVPAGTPQVASGLADELGNTANTFEQITNYNNYYEFSTDKEAVASLSGDFKASPWTVEVGGLVNKPKTFGVEELLRLQQVERVYRLRCVEAWSMVIPWMGFELKQLLDLVEPMASAKYVRFVTVDRPEEMPGQNSPFYNWPYDEGLRLDEAYHRLTLLGTGLYGSSLLNQNGAPIRLVVPWKYGFKSIKSIVKIELTEQEPPTFWSNIAPNEYGFYANVNPDVDHPRWSQRTERRIGEISRIDTLMFNGYAEEVAGLYSSMDLSIQY